MTVTAAAQSRISSDKTSSVATETVRTGLGGDDGNKMTAGLAAAARRLDSSKSSNETAAVAMATVQTGPGGDGGDKMTATAAASQASRSINETAAVATEMV